MVWFGIKLWIKPMSILVNQCGFPILNKRVLLNCIDFLYFFLIINLT